MSPQCGHYLIFISLITLCIATQNLKSTEQQVSAVQSSLSNNPSPKQNDEVKARDKNVNGGSTQKNIQENEGTHVSSQNTTVSTKPTTATDAVSSSVTDPSENIGTGSVNPIVRNIGTGAVVRGFYVFVGLGAIVVMYIVVRTIRLKRKKTTVRKYGVLANREDVEMTPLGAEDEEEESTLFDMTKSRT